MIPLRSQPKLGLNRTGDQPASSRGGRGRLMSTISARRACPSNVWGRTRRSGKDTEKPRRASTGVAATRSITRYRGPSKRISRSASAPLVRSLMRMSVASSFHGMSNAFPLYSVLSSPLAWQFNIEIDLTQYGAEWAGSRRSWTVAIHSLAPLFWWNSNSTRARPAGGDQLPYRTSTVTRIG